MKYKEMPINDKEKQDQFKVGDEVRIYSGQGVSDRKVEEVLSTGMLRFTESVFNSYLHHYKQCRKIVEVEPREFYLDLDEKRVYNVEDLFVMITGGFAVRNGVSIPSNLVHVVEKVE